MTGQSSSRSNGGGAVQVERDGVRLTWNALAVLGSLGLGLYVTGVVTPITEDVEGVQELLAAQRVELTILKKELQQLQQEGLQDYAQIRQGLAVLDQRCKFCGGGASSAPTTER